MKNIVVENLLIGCTPDGLAETSDDLPHETYLYLWNDIVKDGKESSQGIAYLEDGTMIVVEGGRKYIGQTTDVVVTSVLQTAAGRMIFAKPKDN